MNRSPFKRVRKTHATVAIGLAAIITAACVTAANGLLAQAANGRCQILRPVRNVEVFEQYMFDGFCPNNTTADWNGDWTAKWTITNANNERKMFLELPLYADINHFASPVAFINITEDMRAHCEPMGGYCSLELAVYDPQGKVKEDSGVARPMRIFSSCNPLARPTDCEPYAAQVDLGIGKEYSTLSLSSPLFFQGEPNPYNLTPYGTTALIVRTSVGRGYGSIYEIPPVTIALTDGGSEDILLNSELLQASIDEYGPPEISNPWTQQYGPISLGDGNGSCQQAGPDTVSCTEVVLTPIRQAYGSQAYFLPSLTVAYRADISQLCDDPVYNENSKVKTFYQDPVTFTTFHTREDLIEFTHHNWQNDGERRYRIIGKSLLNWEGGYPPLGSDGQDPNIPWDNSNHNDPTIVVADFQETECEYFAEWICEMVGTPIEQKYTNIRELTRIASLDLRGARLSTSRGYVVSEPLTVNLACTPDSLLPAAPTCNNNGTCDPGETTQSCPNDCPSGGAQGGGGAIGGGTPGGGNNGVAGGPVCGDGQCEFPEDTSSCAQDCSAAGNGGGGTPGGEGTPGGGTPGRGMTIGGGTSIGGNPVGGGFPGGGAIGVAGGGFVGGAFGGGVSGTIGGGTSLPAGGGRAIVRDAFDERNRGPGTACDNDCNCDADESAESCPGDCGPAAGLAGSDTSLVNLRTSSPVGTVEDPQGTRPTVEDPWLRKLMPFLFD